MNITAEQKTRLKNSIDFVEFYSEYLDNPKYQMKRSGRLYWAKCCFHPNEDNTPSFSIDPESGVWKCWSENISGDVIAFYEKFHNKGYIATVLELAEKYDVDISIDEDYRKKLNYDKQLKKIARQMLTKYRNALKDNKEATLYLQSRGFSQELIDKFQIGCGFNNVTVTNELKALSLIKQSQDSDSYYNRFRSNRIVIPRFDDTGDVIGFTGRTIDDSKPKYLHSDNSPICNKSNHLFGLNLAKPFIQKLNGVVLVEGEIDCIKAHSAGIVNCVATSGLSLSKAQVSLLRKLTTRFFICVEDVKGHKGLFKLYKDIIEVEPMADIRVIQLYDDEKMDMDEFLTKKSPKDFLVRVRDSLVFNEYVISHMLTNVDYKTIEDKRRQVEKMKPYMWAIKDSVVRNQYIELISHKLEIPQLDIYRIMNNKSEYRKKPEFNLNYDMRHVLAQKMLISLLFSNFHIVVIIQLLEKYSIEEYMEELYEKVYKYIKSKVLQNYTKKDIVNEVYSGSSNKKLISIITDIIFKAQELDCYEESDLDEFIQDQLNCLDFIKRRRENESR